jgi:acyl carrier protein
MSQSMSNANIQTPLTAKDIQNWLIGQLAEQLEVEPDDVDTQLTFDSFGLDSMKGMLIASRAEKWLGRELSPTLLWHYPTIESLSQRLAEESEMTESEVFEI